MHTPVTLKPRHGPGRVTRKARAFVTEIARLHSEGYTLQNIREALADAGVIVSTSTVQREVARLSVPSHSDAQADSLGMPERAWSQSPSLSIRRRKRSPRAVAPLLDEDMAHLDDALEAFFARISPDSTFRDDAVDSPQQRSWRDAVRSILRSPPVALSKTWAALTRPLRR